MYAINEDKSFFNLGAWAVMALARESFVPGITLSDTSLKAALKNKFVRVFPVSGWPIAELVCKQITQPCVIWDVIHYDSSTTYFGAYELTEEEQENASLIEDVFFSNDNIYIVATKQPINKVYVRFKGV